MAVKPLPLQEQWIRVLLETDTITYTATDAAGNTGNATRTVTVVGSGGGESFGDVVIYAKQFHHVNRPGDDRGRSCRERGMWWRFMWGAS